jgi:hypothetical protein
VGQATLQAPSVRSANYLTEGRQARGLSRFETAGVAHRVMEDLRHD